MTLPIRWRFACAVTSVLAVAALASPAGGAPIVTTVTLNDQVGDVTPSPRDAADIITSTAAYKPAEITFTLKTQLPEDPRVTPNWTSPTTGIDFLIRTTTAAPGYDFDLHYALVNGAIPGNVYRASDTSLASPLCAATSATYSGKAHRVSIDPACIGRPGSLTYGPILNYKSDINDAASDVLNDTPDNGNFSAALVRQKLGYWLVGRDGGIFAFGDAKFRGSTGSIKLNKPIVGMAVTPNGRGYWLVASDGGVFAFGNGANFFGSTGDIKLAQPIVGIAPTNSNGGYWFVAADGGIFSFGDAKFYGAAVGSSFPVVSMAAAKDGLGYSIVRADGSVVNRGSAPLAGSLVGHNLSRPVVGIAATL